MNFRRILEENLWAIIMTIISGFLAFAIGTTRTGDRLERLEAQTHADQSFNACAIRHFDHIESGATGAFPCQLQ